MPEKLPWDLLSRSLSSFVHDHLGETLDAFYGFSDIRPSSENKEFSRFVSDLSSHLSKLRKLHDGYRDFRNSEEAPHNFEVTLKQYRGELAPLNEEAALLAKRAAALHLKFDRDSHSTEFGDALERLVQIPVKFSADQLGEKIKVDLFSENLHSFLSELLQTNFFDRTGTPVEVVYRGKDVGAVQFDRKLLDRSIKNLVNDAINHTPGRPVFVTLYRRSGKAVVTVTNHGKKLSNADIAKIGNVRFTSAMQDPRRGYGKISVRMCTEAQGGRFGVGNSRIGPRLSLHFPLARSAA